MTAIIVIVTTLIAALLNACSSVLQRQAAGSPHPKELFRGRFIALLLKNKRWLTGMGLQIAGAAFNGVALFFGSLVLVEPLLATDLVFLMLILHFRFRINVGRREWGGVAAIILGLTMLLEAASPRNGHGHSSGKYWALMGIIVATLVLASAVVMRRHSSPKLRAALGALATGLNFALTAGLMKLLFTRFPHGTVAILSGWQLWAFVASGMTSVVVTQSMYGAGPLAISQPILEITEPLASGAIGLLLFDDMVNFGTAALAFEVIGGLLAAGGIIAMGGSKRIIRPGPVTS